MWECVCQLGKMLCCDELFEQLIDMFIKCLYWEEMEVVGICMFELQSLCFWCLCF